MRQSLYQTLAQQVKYQYLQEPYTELASLTHKKPFPAHQLRILKVVLHSSNVLQIGLENTAITPYRLRNVGPRAAFAVELWQPRGQSVEHFVAHRPNFGGIRCPCSAGL